MKKLMILGGGSNQIPLIKAAKKNGFYVVLCDYSEKAPGVVLADKFCLVSIMDLEGVVNAAKEQQVDGIFTNSEPAMQIATDAANRLGLPANPSAVIELLSSKAQFRKLQKEHHFVVPASGVAANLEEAKQLAEAMTKVKAVAIMDKAESFSNSGGPLFSEARSSLYDLPNKPYCINYIYGLGGRDITVEDYYEIFNDLFIIHDTDDPGDIYRYVGVRDSRYGERGFDHRKYED